MPQFNGLGKSAADLATSVKLNCDIWSYPPVNTIKFVRNGKELTSSPDITVSNIEYNVNSLEYYQRRVLEIQSVKPADYGAYACQAENSLGVKEYSISLTRTSTYMEIDELSLKLKTETHIKNMSIKRMFCPWITRDATWKDNSH